jgi:hypothetical protein
MSTTPDTFRGEEIRQRHIDQLLEARGESSKAARKDKPSTRLFNSANDPVFLHPILRPEGGSKSAKFQVVPESPKDAKDGRFTFNDELKSLKGALLKNEANFGPLHPWEGFSSSSNEVSTVMVLPVTKPYAEFTHDPQEAITALPPWKIVWPKTFPQETDDELRIRLSQLTNMEHTAPQLVPLLTPADSQSLSRTRPTWPGDYDCSENRKGGWPQLKFQVIEWISGNSRKAVTPRQLEEWGRGAILTALAWLSDYRDLPLRPYPFR